MTQEVIPQGNCQGGELDKSHGSVFILREDGFPSSPCVANGTSQMKQLRCKPCGTVAEDTWGIHLNTKSNSLECLIQYAISTSSYGSYRKHEGIMKMEKDKREHQGTQPGRISLQVPRRGSIRGMLMELQPRDAHGTVPVLVDRRTPCWSPTPKGPKQIIYLSQFYRHLKS